MCGAAASLQRGRSPGLQHSIILIAWQLCLTCRNLKGRPGVSGSPQTAAKSGLLQQINARSLYLPWSL